METSYKQVFLCRYIDIHLSQIIYEETENNLQNDIFFYLKKPDIYREDLPSTVGLRNSVEGSPQNVHELTEFCAREQYTHYMVLQFCRK